jgi:hypothetical protein
MDFKEYYHQKLDEEMATQQSAAEQSYETQSMNSNIGSILQVYVKNGDLKEGLKKLGADLGAEIVRYAIEQYANREEFESDDTFQKYVNGVNQKIEQNAAKTLAELMKHIAVDISNMKNSLAM